MGELQAIFPPLRNRVSIGTPSSNSNIYGGSSAATLVPFKLLSWSMYATAINPSAISMRTMNGWSGRMSSCTSKGSARQPMSTQLSNTMKVNAPAIRNLMGCAYSYRLMKRHLETCATRIGKNGWTSVSPTLPLSTLKLLYI